MRLPDKVASRAPALVGCALALLVWIGPLRLGAYRGDVITDIPTYRRAADRILDGLVPYGDFPLEYPPLAAALFALPEMLPGDYNAWFSTLMLLALIATVLGTAATARAIGLGAERQLAASVAVALSPLALGLLVETRFDLVVTAIISWTLFAAATDRWRLAWGLVGMGVLVKLMPLILVPVLVVFHLHRRGGAETLRGVATGALVAVVGLLPFAVTSPSGTWDLFSYHLERPLQIESTGSAYLLSLHALADVAVRVETSFGSQGLAGEGPRILAAISGAAVIALVVAVALTLHFGLRRAHPSFAARLFVAACAATIAAGLAGGKVLSPQFVLWLLPVGFIVAGRYGWASFAVTAAAILATGAYFPHWYWDLVALENRPIALLVVRDALLVGLVAAAWPRPSIGRPPASVELPPASTATDAARSPSARYLTG